MVPHTWQSPSSSPPQRPLTSQQPPISLSFTIFYFKTQPLFEESIFHLILFLPTFTFTRLPFPHNSSTHSVKFQFQVESDPVTEQSPSSPRHLASHIPVDARHTLKQKTCHTSSPMLATLWNKRHVTHPRRWERHSETKDKVVSTWDDALVSICLSWQSQ